MVVEVGSFADRVEAYVHGQLERKRSEAQQRFDEIKGNFARDRKILHNYNVKGQFEQAASILSESLGYICDVGEEGEPELDLSNPQKPEIKGEGKRYSLSLRWYDPQKVKSWDICVIVGDERIEVLSFLNHVVELPVDVTAELLNDAIFDAFTRPREITNDWVAARK